MLVVKGDFADMELATDIQKGRQKSKLKINMVPGATATGKSDRAAELAERVGGAPIVVMDRMQCFPEMWIAANRTQFDDHPEANFIFLKNAKIEDGEIRAVEAHNLLVKRILELEAKHDTIFAEGGSISLWKEFERNLPYWQARYELEFIVQRIPTNLEQYRERIRKRLQKSFFREDENSLLGEFERNYPLYASIAPWLDTVGGYTQLIEWMEENDKSLADLYELELFPNSLEIVEVIVEATVAYGLAQQEFIDNFLINNGLTSVDGA